jgi:hypothetical protein
VPLALHQFLTRNEQRTGRPINIHKIFIKLLLTFNHAGAKLRQLNLWKLLPAFTFFGFIFTAPQNGLPLAVLKRA